VLCKHEVAGSIPVTSTNPFNHFPAIRVFSSTAL
jgi:hypothetical protein